MIVRSVCIQILILIVSLSIAYPQTTSSPYSIYGLGLVQDYGFGVSNGMGGTGIAFKSKNFLNNINPASLNDIDSLSFIFEMGAFGKHTTYEYLKEKQTKFDANLRYIALGFRIYNWWGVSLGAVPYSSVGYTINSTINLGGELGNVKKTFSGSGGITQFYMANSFKLFKNLSVGINSSYFSGSIVKKETVASTSTMNGYVLNTTNYIHNFYFDYGLQYSLQMNELQYTIGLIYGMKKKLKNENDVSIELENNTVELESSDEQFYIPEKLGIGMAIEKEEKFRGGFDFEKAFWPKNMFQNSKLKTRNTNRISAGIEYTPRKSSKDVGFKKLYYRLGAFYNESYLTIDKTPINKQAIVFGFGMPIKKDLSIINFSFEIGQNGTLSNRMIKEKYWMVQLNYTMNDIWFVKRKYY